MYVLIRKYVNVRINFLKTILKNIYIWFEEYGALIEMNSDGRMSVDKCLWTEGWWRWDDHDGRQTTTWQPQHYKALHSSSSATMADNNTVAMRLWNNKIYIHARRQHWELSRTWQPSHSNPKHTIPLSWLQA
jgi:hypothetical protein